MRKCYSLFFLLLLPNLSECQEARLRIMGTSRYTDLAEKRIFVLTFENNPEICNPLTQNKPIDIQLEELKDKLKNANINSEFILHNALESKSERSRTYEVKLPADVDANTVQKIITQSGIRKVKSYFKFSDNAFENEDKKAILSFKNSEQTAKILAKTINYEISEIVSIDDDTSDSNNIYEELGIEDLDDNKKEMMYQLYDKLKSMPELNNSYTREGNYNLWVTYKIKPKQ